MEKTNASKQGVLHWLDENFEKMFLVTGLLSITLFITWQVIYRYIITQFIERAGAAVWTEEISRYIFIWISYLALSIAIKKRSSIRVDMLYDHLPPRLQQISWVVVEVLFLILTATIAYYGWGQIERLQEYPQHTTALRIPFLIPYLILPFGFGLMCFRLLQSLYKQAKVCGLVDTLIGLVAVFVIASPVIFCEYIEPLPALFGYFIVMCAIGVPSASACPRWRPSSARIPFLSNTWLRWPLRPSTASPLWPSRSSSRLACSWVRAGFPPASCPLLTKSSAALTAASA